MYIEDEELRTLYRDASKDHLDKLEAGFLHLESHPDDSTKLKELLRATHSLKGDSRMLGVQDAETLTHQLEDLLSSLEQGQRQVTPALCDCFYLGLDAIRKIAREAVTGESSNVSVFHVLAQLMNAGDASASMSETGVDSGDITESEIVEPVAKPQDHNPQQSAEPALALSAVEALELQLEASLENSLDSGPGKGDQMPDAVTSSGPMPAAPPVESPAPLAETYQIDTIRVDAAKLDTLMTQAGELAVTKRRITRRMGDIDGVLLFWEAWVRDSLVNRLDGELSTAGGEAPLLQLQQSVDERLERLGALLKRLRTTAYEDSAQLETLSNDLESGILKLRQVPLSSLFSLFPRMVRDLAKAQGKLINLVIEGGDIQADKRILEEMKAPLTHLIRNAIDHGIEAPSERISMDKAATATICLKARQRGSLIDIDIVDDGRGLSLESIKRTAVRRGLHTEATLATLNPDQIHDLIFMPGFSTRTTVTEISGRGVGLDVVRVNVERLKGSIQVTSSPAQGCSFRFTLNTSLARASALIVAINKTAYAIPVEFVEVMMRVDRRDIFTLEGSPTINVQGKPLSIAWLNDLLEMPVSVALGSQQQSRLPQQSVACVVIRVGAERLGLFVDELIDQQDIVLKPHSKLLKRIRNISGATILGTGEVCMVLSPQDLLKSSQGKAIEPVVAGWDPPVERPKILLVEDSLPIRTQVRRILEGVGYRVTVAVDGLDGFEKLQQDTFDAVVSDVEMPNMSGLQLTTQIREESQYDPLPIVLVTTLAKEDDRRRGTDAGANAYITKGDFDQSLLIDTLRSLI